MALGRAVFGWFIGYGIALHWGLPSWGNAIMDSRFDWAIVCAMFAYCLSSRAQNKEPAHD